MGNARKFLSEHAEEIKKREERAKLKPRKKKLPKKTKNTKIFREVICDCCREKFIQDMDTPYGKSNQRNCPACRGYQNANKRKMVKELGSIEAYNKAIKKIAPLHRLALMSIGELNEQYKIRTSAGMATNAVRNEILKRREE